MKSFEFICSSQFLFSSNLSAIYGVSKLSLCFFGFVLQHFLKIFHIFIQGFIFSTFDSDIFFLNLPSLCSFAEIARLQLSNLAFLVRSEVFTMLTRMVFESLNNGCSHKQKWTKHCTNEELCLNYLNGKVLPLILAHPNHSHFCT